MNREEMERVFFEEAEETELKALLDLLELEKRRMDIDIAGDFVPYPKQKEFYSQKAKIRVFFGGNQVGKSTLGAYEIYCHITGRYPPDWEGIRYHRPVDVWVVGVTSQRVRDTIQAKLFGRIGNMGGGFVNPSEVTKIVAKQGTPFAIDLAFVKHISGGLSSVQFFSYDQRREKFQGSTIDIIWMDEEPPEDVDGECRMRILAKKGMIFYTFTPLSGVTPLVDRLIRDEKVPKVWMTMNDALHLDAEMKESLLAGLDEYERKARELGIPAQSIGSIFQYNENDIMYPANMEIPDHWLRLGSLDVGVNHPTAALAAAYDDLSGTIYVYAEYRAPDRPPYENAARIKPWNVKHMTDPSAWNRSIASVQTPASLYIQEGLRLERANNSVDYGIILIRQKLAAGKLLIADNLVLLLEEMRLYRRNEKGDIIKIKDDLVDCLRYLVCGIVEGHAESKRNKKKELPEQQLARDGYY